MPGGRPLRRTVRVGVAVAPMKQLTHTVAVSRTKRRNSPVSQSLGRQKLQPDVVFFGWNRALNVLISDCSRRPIAGRSALRRQWQCDEPELYGPAGSAI